MSVSPRLLGFLCCPVTGQSLREATEYEARAFHAKAGAMEHIPAQQSLNNPEPPLVRADSRLAYPVSNGIPVLLPDAGMAL